MDSDNARSLFRMELEFELELEFSEFGSPEPATPPLMPANCACKLDNADKVTCRAEEGRLAEFCCCFCKEFPSSQPGEGEMRGLG